MRMIQRSTRKSGHSVITTLPPDVLKRLNIKVGDQVEYVIKGNQIFAKQSSQKMIFWQLLMR